MYRPDIKLTKSGVPVLSKKEIDMIGEKLVGEFAPQALVTPQEIDIDLFVQDYLGMEQDFQYLSHCGMYLGMTVFEDSDKIPVYDPQNKRAEYISAKAHTVIIDRTLLENGQEQRYRFTMGHEAGHEFLHKKYFSHVPMVRCRVDYGKANTKLSAPWTDHDWMEWQANELAAAVLMPVSMVHAVVREVKESGVAEHLLSYTTVGQVADVFQVSLEAAGYRLMQLGYMT